MMLCMSIDCAQLERSVWVPLQATSPLLNAQYSTQLTSTDTLTCSAKTMNSSSETFHGNTIQRGGWGSEMISTKTTARLGECVKGIGAPCLLLLWPSNLCLKATHMA